MPIDYFIDLNCQGPHGCPESEWIKYLDQIDAHQEKYEDRWICVAEKYPVTGQIVLILFEGVVTEARYVCRGHCWEIPNDTFIPAKYVDYWRKRPYHPTGDCYFWE